MAASPFALLAPGRPLNTHFSTSDGTRFLLDVPLPCDSFALTLLTAEVPPGHGFAVYWAVAPHSNWQYLGALSVDNPTSFFDSPWVTDDPLAGIDPAAAAAVAPVGIQLGISLETAEFLGNLTGAAAARAKLPDRVLGVDAMAIATNLCNFLGSISEVPPGLLSAIDKWAAKFGQKLARDPKFYLKGD